MLLSDEELDRRSEARLTAYLIRWMFVCAMIGVALGMMLLVPGPFTAVAAEPLRVPDGWEPWYGAVMVLLGAPTIYFAIYLMLHPTR